MSPDVSDTSALNAPPPRMRYTLVLLDASGEWFDVQTIYAVDDVEALGICKFLTGGDPFELWQGLSCVAYFTGAIH